MAVQNHLDFPIGIARAAELDYRHLDLRRGTDDLEGAPLALHEGRVQDVVPGDGMLDRDVKCLHFQRAADAHLTRHRVAGRPLGRAAGSPDPLLGERAGHRHVAAGPTESRRVR